MVTLTDGTATAQPAVAPAAPDLPPGDRGALLRVARRALAIATGERPPESLAEVLHDAGRLDVGGLQGMAFVTLHQLGELRGCMGSLATWRSLPEAVADAAFTVAVADPRFLPLHVSELRDVWIDISVLGPMMELGDPGRLRPGVDGVVVERHGRRGLLLPEVAPAQGWGAEELLAAACAKAGLSTDAWREPGARVLAFRTTRFGGPAREPEGERPVEVGAG